MKPINYLDRRRAIRTFCFLYLATCATFIYWLILAFFTLPKAERKLVAAGQSELKTLLDYATVADSLTNKIAKEGSLNSSNLVPFFKWATDLKTAYPKPVFTNLVDNYIAFANEIILLGEKDSALVSAQGKLIALKKEQQLLMEKNDALKAQLRGAQSTKEL